MDRKIREGVELSNYQMDSSDPDFFSAEELENKIENLKGEVDSMKTLKVKDLFDGEVEKIDLVSDVIEEAEKVINESKDIVKENIEEKKNKKVIKHVSIGRKSKYHQVDISQRLINQRKNHFIPDSDVLKTMQGLMNIKGVPVVFAGDVADFLEKEGIATRYQEGTGYKRDRFDQTLKYLTVTGKIVRIKEKPSRSGKVYITTPDKVSKALEMLGNEAFVQEVVLKQSKNRNK